jgi:UDP-glucose 4-epimerase
MRILILGGAGFIGGHLQSLLAPLYDVFTADIVGDATDRHHIISSAGGDFGPLMDKVRPDVCVNCCGAANVGASFADPREDFRLNAVLVHDVLEAIRQFSPATRLLNLSSAAIYGNPAHVPVEEASVPAPISPYGWHKQISESICLEYTRCFNIGTLSLRPFSVYGPGLKKQLFWDIYQKSRSSQNILCPGTGNETRDFVHVQDMAQAILLCMKNADFDGSAMNVANGQGITIRYAIETLLSAIGWTGDLQFNNLVRDGDPLYWTADVTRLKALGYNPAFQFESGISELSTWLINLP